MIVMMMMILTMIMMMMTIMLMMVTILSHRVGSFISRKVAAKQELATVRNEDDDGDDNDVVESHICVW